MNLRDIKTMLMKRKSIQDIILGMLSFSREDAIIVNHGFFQVAVFEKKSTTTLKAIKELTFNMKEGIPYSEELETAFNGLEKEMILEGKNIYLLKSMQEKIKEATTKFSTKEAEELKSMFELMNKFKNSKVINDKEFMELFVTTMGKSGKVGIPNNYVTIIEDIIYSKAINSFTRIINMEDFLMDTSKFEKNLRINFKEFLREHNRKPLGYDSSTDLIIVETSNRTNIMILAKYDEETKEQMDEFCLLFAKNIKESDKQKSEHANGGYKIKPTYQANVRGKR